MMIGLYLLSVPFIVLIWSVVKARDRVVVAEVLFVGAFFMLISVMANDLLSGGVVLLQAAVATVTIRCCAKSIKYVEDVKVILRTLWFELIAWWALLLLLACGMSSGCSEAEPFFYSWGAATILILFVAIHPTERWIIGIVERNAVNTNLQSLK